MYRLLNVAVERREPNKNELKKLLDEDEKFTRRQADKQWELALCYDEVAKLKNALNNAKSKKLDSVDGLNERLRCQEENEKELIQSIVVLNLERKRSQCKQEELEDALAKSEKTAKYELAMIYFKIWCL